MLYTIFVIISIVINITGQEATILLFPESIFLSIVVGTGAGLVTKYILDKKYVFNYTTTNKKQDGKLFILYSFMGIFTTLIFWAVEYSFELIFVDKTMRYIGGVIGLIIGYSIKYILDKKYVFKK